MRIEWSLGRFGDLRRDKRGRSCSEGCCAPAMYAFAGWREACGQGKWLFGGSSATRASQWNT